MSYRKLSRRDALKYLAAGATGIVVAGCAPQPTPAQPAAKAPEPTKAPAAAAQATQAPAPTKAPAAKSPATLIHWFFADDPHQTEVHQDFVKKFMDANPNITVKAEAVNPVADLYKKMMTAFAAGAGMPDTCEGQSSWVAELNRAKVLPDYESRLKTWAHYKDWLPTVEALAHGNKPGDPVGILPNKVQIQYTYYRADWLKEAGLQPPQTQEEMVKVAQALNKPPDRYGVAMRGGDTGFWGFQLANYLRGNGVEIIKQDGTTDVDSPEAIATVDWFASWFTKLKITQPSATTDKYPELFAQLQSGKLGLFEHGLWSYKIMSDALGDKVAAVSKMKGKKSRFVPCYTEGPMFFKTSKFQDEGWQFCAFTAAPEPTAIWAKERGAGPTFKQQVDEAFFKENRFFKAALESAPDWGQIPYHKNGTKMNDLLAPEFQLVLQGNSTPEKFCKNLAKALREE